MYVVVRQAWCVRAWFVWDWFGSEWHGRLGLLCCGSVSYGKAWSGRHGGSWQVRARNGLVGFAWQSGFVMECPGGVRLGSERFGKAGKARYGKVRFVVVW